MKKNPTREAMYEQPYDEVDHSGYSTYNIDESECIYSDPEVDHQYDEQYHTASPQFKISSSSNSNQSCQHKNPHFSSSPQKQSSLTIEIE